MAEETLKEQLEVIAYKVSMDGVDYFLTEYASPKEFDFDPELKEVATAYVDARIKIIQRLEKIMEENGVDFEYE